MARKIAKKEYSYTHGQLFSRISAVMKFVAEGPTRTLGSLNVATMRAARDDSLRVRGPIRARSAQCLRTEHRLVPTWALRQEEHLHSTSFPPSQGILPGPGEARFPGLLKGARQHANQSATRCEQ